MWLMLPVERLVKHGRQARMLGYRPRVRLLVLLLVVVLWEHRMRVRLLEHRTSAQGCLLLLVVAEEVMLNVS